MSHGVTCAVSHLPIEPGTPVRVLLLTENPYSENRGSRATAIHDWSKARQDKLLAIFAARDASRA